MYDSPPTLERLCLDAVCDSVLEVFELYYEQKSSEGDEEGDAGVVRKKFRFKDADVFLYNEISEKLLERLSERGLLCDSTLSLFSERNTRLKSVRIRNCKKVSAEGLKVLRRHKITDLECINLRNVSISKILGECRFDRFST